MAKKSKVVLCKNCNAEMVANAKVCSSCGAKNKKPFYKRGWFIALIVVFIIGIGTSNGGDSSVDDTDDSQNNSSQVNEVVDDTTIEEKNEIIVIDFSTMEKAAIETWADANNIRISIESKYSDAIEVGAFIEQSTVTGDTIYEGEEITISYSLGKEPSIEFKNALKKAETYSEMMNMSKRAIFQQLTSDFGEQFPEEAAQYAIDNMEADWNANALAKAKTYQETMSMSSNAIYDQLVSEYGEQFTAEEAQYAIDNLNN
ncbi:MAG: Ltp family lipoprotein [Eubacteriales bacterium]